MCVFLCRGVPCVSDCYVYGGEDPWISDWFVCMFVGGGGWVSDQFVCMCGGEGSPG